MAAPGLLRRLGAIIYDTFLLLAVLFFATAVILPFNAGQAFGSGQLLYSAYLLFVSYVFFAWFWIHGGQTLGMRAWKIRLCRMDGSALDWGCAAIRFLAAGLSWVCLGLGFGWCLFDKQQRCWHDRLSKTRLILVQGEKSGPQN